MKISKITSISPKTLTKTISIGANGSLNRSTVANMSEGVVETCLISSLDELAALLTDLKRDQALCYGIPSEPKSKLLSKKSYQKQGNPEGVITRTKDNFYWPEGAGVFYIDYDPPAGKEPMTRTELIQALFSVVPELECSGYVWWCSSSSLIYNSQTNEQITGVKGQRIYIPVKEASDIPRAGKVLVERLWLAGKGFYEVGAAGQKLERSLVDASVWQTNRLDFAAGANCIDPLEQRRGEPVVTEGPLFDTVGGLPDLTRSEKKRVQKLKAEAKLAVEVEAQAAYQDYVEETATSIAGSQDGEKSLEVARAVVIRALDHGTLTGDFKLILEGGEKVTVGQLLDNPQRYHLCQTLDPIEPEYCNRKVVGKLYLIGARPNLHSFAHGGKNYKLVRQPRRVELVRGRTHDAVLETLSLIKELPDVFDYGESIATVEGGELVTFSENLLIHWLGGVAQYWGWRKTPNGDMYEVDEDPKLNIVRPLMEMKRGLKPLEAVVTAPTITLTGQLVNKLGYHASSRLFLDTLEDLPNIPERPNSSQVLDAFGVLMKPFNDFPFASNLDRSVLLSGLLSACVRPVLQTCPAHAYDAPVQGSGKTLLAECNAILATGEAPDVWPHTSGRDDEETRKRLFTALKSGKRTVVWDNILGVFDSAAMAAFLTSSNFTDRVLGQSKELTVPNKMLLLMTGNNLSLAGDMPRRVLTCRIDPKTDEPYKREFKVCPRSYVLANRQKLVAAALTIIKGWFASDDYAGGVTASGRMASFENWDDLVRQPIAWMARSNCVLGLVDVMSVIDQAQQSDPEQEALHELLEAIRDRFGGAFFTAKDLVDNGLNFDEKCGRISDALKEVAPNANVASSRGVGKILRYRRERVVKGLCLESRQLKDHYQFRVQKVGDGLSSYAPSLSNGLNGRALN